MRLHAGDHLRCPNGHGCYRLTGDPTSVYDHTDSQVGDVGGSFECKFCGTYVSAGQVHGLQQCHDTILSDPAIPD